MNKEQPIRDQAERLRQRISKMNEEKKEESAADTEISSLPPRSAVHKSKKKIFKVKIRYPAIRLLVLFFILLPIVIYSIYMFKGTDLKGSNNKSVKDSENYETVNLEKRDDSDKDKEIQPSDHLQEMDEDENEELKKGEVNSKVAPPIQSGNSSDTKSTGDKSVDSQYNGNQSNEGNSGGNGSGEKLIYHTVQSNESLYSISMKYYHNKSGVEIIKQANGLQNDDILAGQILKIPLK